MAALTVTAVAAPEAVSYAGIAGLPGQQGLYTGLLGPLAYALAGASPQLMVGPTAIMCILTHNAIPNRWGGEAVAQCDATHPGCDTRIALAGLLALAMALLQALIGALRLGSLVALISQPIVVGFTSGSALLTASSQFSTLFALTDARGQAAKCAAFDSLGEPIGCTFGQAVVDVFQRSSTINWGVFGLGCACCALLYAVRAAPYALGKRFQLLASLAPLVLVVVIIPLSYGFQGYFCAKLGQCVAAIPSGLPPLSRPFDALRQGSYADWGALLRAALPLAIIGYMGAVTIAKTISRQYGPYAVYADAELWGQVAANAACGLGSAIPVTGSFSRSAVNCSSGARTGAASILTALSMALALLCLTQPLAYIPSVARSAIVLVAIGKMIELHLLPVFWAGERRDAAVFLVTLLVVLFADSASGLVAGLAVQWVFALLRHSGEPTRVRLQAWVRGSLSATGAHGAGAATLAALPAAGGSSSSSSCEAALAQMRVQGMAWKDVTSMATLASAGGGDIGGAAAPPQFPHCAVTVQWAPDLHFSACERLAEAVGEAVALFAPRCVLIDCSGGAAGAGLFLDATGAAELLTLVHTLPSTCALLVFGLSNSSLGQLQCQWQASGGSSSKGSSSSSSSSSSSAGDSAWRRAFHASVERCGGHAFGSLYACASSALADKAALEVCALGAALVQEAEGGAGGRGSLQGGLGAPLLHSGAAALVTVAGDTEDDGEGGEGSGNADAAALKQRPVEGVPPSPLAVRSSRTRLALGLQPSLAPVQQMSAFKASVAGREEEDKTLAAAAGRLAEELKDLARQAVKHVSGEAPLLVAANEED